MNEINCAGFSCSQYLTWLGNLLTGDFGVSMRSGQPVTREIMASGGRTLFLTLGSLVVTLAVAVPIGVYAALQPGGRRAWALTMFAYLVSALPTFWIGYLVIYLFTSQFGMLPILSGTGDSQPYEWLYALLPVLVLGLGNGAFAEVVRYVREETGRVLSEEYVRTARAKGAALWRHVYKEGLLLPVAEIIASKMPFVLGGAIFDEDGDRGSSLAVPATGDRHHAGRTRGRRTDAFESWSLAPP